MCPGLDVPKRADWILDIFRPEAVVGKAEAGLCALNADFYHV